VRGRGRHLHAALAPVDVGQTVFGYVLALAPVDDGFARRLRDATRDDIVIVGGDGVAGSTLRGDPPWRTVTAWRAQGPDERRREAAVGTQRVSASGVALSATPPLVAIVHASRGDTAAPFRALEQGVVWIGAAAILVLLAGLLLAARWVGGRTPAGAQRV
jgi:hypothetical protein